MTPAIELVDVTKIYRRFTGRQFATLKSALLKRSLLRDLRPNEAFLAPIMCFRLPISPSPLKPAPPRFFY